MTADRSMSAQAQSVLEFVKSCSEPVTLNQMAQAAGVPKKRLSKAINDLKQTGRLYRINPEVQSTSAHPALYSHINPGKRRADVVPPMTINKMEGVYTPPRWVSHRPGAMDAFSIPSRGF